MATQSPASPAYPAYPARSPSTAATQAGLSIVAGLDFTDADGPAFDLAATIATRVAGSHVHLVHVFGAEPSTERSRDLSAHLRLYVEEKTAADSRLSAVTFGIHLRGGKAVRELVQLATEVRADFIVVGSHQGHHLASWIGGSTVERLIRGGNFAVLVAPSVKEPAQHEPTIEPPCPDCVAERFASSGRSWWCARHSHSAIRGHAYSYQRELPLATHDSAITPTGIDF